jgi:2-amino-4-hydroxy-6-hydroxymethyldihydropteridine diphosphokinase
MSEPSSTPEVRRVFLSLGSNTGNRERQLTDAIESLPGLVAVSPLYETEPVGGPAQGPFLNVVVELATHLSPRELLGIAHRLESAAGRVRAEHWGPRSLDVDLLLVGDLKLDEPDLVIPHPRMWDRRFVLAPLADLAPELVPERRLAQADGRVAVIGTLEVAIRGARRT